MSKIELNIQLKFEKLVVNTETRENTWEGVFDTDEAVPVSSLLKAMWKDIDIKINQQRVTGTTFMCQVRNKKLEEAHLWNVFFFSKWQY